MRLDECQIANALNDADYSRNVVMATGILAFEGSGRITFRLDAAHSLVPPPLRTRDRGHPAAHAGLEARG